MLKGIDVSYHQGLIDWEKVRNDNVNFAIIRAGYGKSTVDKRFHENIQKAIANEIMVGVYWFIYAGTVKDAIANADMCHKTISNYKKDIELKVWADWEYDSDKKNKQTKESRTQIVKAFCERLKALGYSVGVYANPDYLNNMFGDLSEYPLWLARYNSEMGNYEPYMWQYTSSGKVSGISGSVDLDRLYGEAEKEIEYFKIPEFTLIESLNQIGVDSSFTNRKKIAKENGIENYKGTAEQNIQMLSLLNEGKLIKG